MSHRMPPGAPKGAHYTCPAKGCGAVITKETEAADLAERATLTEGQLGKRDLAHRKSHFRTQWLNLKLLWTDHRKRVPSLLHFVLNSTASTLVVGIKLGASNAQITAMNKVFKDYHIPYEYKTKKGQRDKKAAGNTCRKVLWTRAFLLALVDARWGPAVTSADRAAEREVASAQAAGAHLANGDDDTAAPPAAPPPPPPRPTPPVTDQPRDTMTTNGMDLAAILWRLLPRHPARECPPPRPRPAPAPTDDHHEAADAQEESDASPASADDLCEPVDDTDTTICTRLTTLKCVHTLLHLHLELHLPWQHDERVAKGKRPSTMALRGRPRCACTTMGSVATTMATLRLLISKN